MYTSVWVWHLSVSAEESWIQNTPFLCVCVRMGVTACAMVFDRPLLLVRWFVGFSLLDNLCPILTSFCKIYIKRGAEERHHKQTSISVDHPNI